MSATTKTLATRMRQFTKLTRSGRLGVAILIPHEDNGVTQAEALEIVELVEEFASELRVVMCSKLPARSLQ